MILAATSNDEADSVSFSAPALPQNWSSFRNSAFMSKDDQENKASWFIWSDGTTSPRLIILDKNGNLIRVEDGG